MSGSLSSPAVTLGNVSLFGWEIPSKMPGGGAQQVVVHKLIGGARVVDVMGRDDRDLQWSGYFRTTDQGDAMSRAMLIDAMRVAGGVQVLTWGDQSFNVVISQFTYDYQNNGFLFPYSITCVIASFPSSASGPSSILAAQSDIESSNSILSSQSAIENSPAQPSALSTAVSNVVAAVNQGAATLAPLVATASAAATAAQAASNAVIAAQAATAAKSGTPFGSISGLQTVAAAQVSLAAATQAGGYLSRAAINLANV